MRTTNLVEISLTGPEMCILYKWRPSPSLISKMVTLRMAILIRMQNFDLIPYIVIEIWLFSKNSRWRRPPCWISPEVVMHLNCGVWCILMSYIYTRWRDDATGKAFGLAISRSRVQILLETTLRNNLRQVVYAYMPLSPSSITWYRPKGGDALRLGR